MKAGGLFFVSFVLVTLFIGFLSIMSVVSAAVYINEIELNPAGSDVGNEWVEIFNSEGTSTPVNLTGWYLKDKDDNTFAFPDETFINYFYVLDNLDAFVNTNETITLYDINDTLIDSAVNVTDNLPVAGDDKTLQRIPNGIGGFILQTNSTKGMSNVITEIQNKSSSPLCVVSGNNVTFSVQVNGECINEVKFLVDINGSVNELIGVNTIGNNYAAVLNTSTFLPSQNITWTVQATNCYNESAQNGNESFYVNNKTSLTHLPSSPDGIGIWY